MSVKVSSGDWPDKDLNAKVTIIISQEDSQP